MLTSVVSSCVRNRKTFLTPSIRSALFSSAKKSSHGTANLVEIPIFSQHRASRLLTAEPWRVPNVLATKFLHLSTAALGDDVPDLLDSSDLSDRENFGSLSVDMSSRKLFRKTSPHVHELRYRQEEDEEHEEQGKPRRRPGRSNTAYWYFLQCKKLIQENKLQEALDMFSKDMLQMERLQPLEFNYSVLIGGCGRAGQLKQAFKLYNDLKKRGLEASDATYTALFNACAESLSKQAGLEQALKLEQELRGKNYPLSTITYHALLKTHAFTNHLHACIQTLKEMLQNGHVITQKAFHFLLMACVNDKEAGFRLALQIWRQMLNSGILPDSKNYNLLLRIARDCGIGDPALATSLLLRPVQKSESRKKSASRRKKVIDIDLLERQLFIQADALSEQKQDNRGSEDESHSKEDMTQLTPVTQTAPVPVNLADGASLNLLDIFEDKVGGVISLGSVDNVSDRLALIGGPKGFLDKMEANGLSPDLRTLTLLTGMIEPGYTSLQMLLKVAKKHEIKLDVAFFNSAIRTAVKSDDPEGAKAVLSVMKQRNVHVNLQTFGCLALGCQRQNDGLQLLTDMEAAGLKPNTYVFSALIGRAAKRLDYVYLKTILKTMKSMGVWPNELIIQQLEFAAQYPLNYNQYMTRNNYLVHIDGFRGYYHQWLKDMPALSKEDEQVQLQMERDCALVKKDATDGLTESQRRQAAAARRFKSQTKSKKSTSNLSKHF